MTRTNVWRLAACGSLAALVAFSTGGCPIVDPTDLPEAVLQGTWKLTTDQSDDLSETFLIFDARGDLSRVEYKVGSVTFTDNSPVGRSDVDGKNVTIDATFAGSGQVFRGTLNDDNTVIEGSAGTTIKFGSIEIDVDNGAVRLEKQ